MFSQQGQQLLPAPHANKVEAWGVQYAQYFTPVSKRAF